MYYYLPTIDGQMIHLLNYIFTNKVYSHKNEYLTYVFTWGCVCTCHMDIGILVDNFTANFHFSFDSSVLWAM